MASGNLTLRASINKKSTIENNKYLELHPGQYNMYFEMIDDECMGLTIAMLRNRCMKNLESGE